MGPDANVLRDHDRSSVHAYIREDIKRSKFVSFNVFVEALFKLSPERMQEWTTIIAREGWHNDRCIAAKLKEFCEPTSESSRYGPLCDIINRVMDLAHHRLPDVPDTYPIDDIAIKQNDPMYIQSNAGHGALGALRKPDCVVLRARHGIGLEPSRSANHEVALVPQPHHVEVPRRARGKTGAVRQPRIQRDSTTPTRRMTRASTKRATMPIPSTPAPTPDPVPPDGDPTSPDTPDNKILSPISWSQVIMNYELKGKAVLKALLASFRLSRKPAAADATAQQGGQQSPKRTRAPKRRAAAPRAKSPKAKEIGREVSVLAGLKRKRGLDDDDDLLNHVRRPDPPTCTLSGSSETPERLSAAVKQASIQAGSYALETLACTFGTRLFCVNVLLKNDRIYLWYYDACGFVYTESISLVEDFEKAVALFVGMARSSPEQLGALPDVIIPPPSAPYPDNWPPENLKGHTLEIPCSSESPGDLIVTLQEPVFAQYVLAGRRTFVYTIKTEPALSNDELIMKFSYQVCTRKEEHVFIDPAREAGVGHLPTVHTWGNLWNMSEGVRSIFYAKDDAEFEDRTLRVIIYNRYLPLDALFPDSPESIPLMAYQMMDCVHDLRYKANILHRDISVNNVMWEMRDGRTHFILIDYDMATFVSSDPDAKYTPSSQHRTGTLPFMAVDLISDAARLCRNPNHKAIAHLLCHDLESIFWLCLWCTLVMLALPDSEQRENMLATVRAWETQELWIIADTKRVLRFSSLRKRGIELPKKAVDAGLKKWFKAWTMSIWTKYEVLRIPLDGADGEDMCEDSDSDYDVPDYDHETGGGIITRDNLKAKLTKVIPESYDTASAAAAAAAAIAETARRTRSQNTEAANPQSEVPNAEEGVAGRGATRSAGGKPSKGKKGTGSAAKKTAKKTTKKAAVAAKKVATAQKDDETNDMRSRLRPRKAR